MSTTDTTQSAELSRWQALLSELVRQVESWAKTRDWSMRRIEKRLDDRELGRHRVPALLLQKETVRVLLEPIARSAPGTDGVVDLYLLPAYDDIASLYHSHDGWKIHYLFPGDQAGGHFSIRDAASIPLTDQSFGDVLDEMVKHAVSAG